MLRLREIRSRSHVVSALRLAVIRYVPPRGGDPVHFRCLVYSWETIRFSPLDMSWTGSPTSRAWTLDADGCCQNKTGKPGFVN